MRQQPQWNWLEPSFCFPDDDCIYLAEAIQQGTCIAVSDGSFKDKKGTASLVLEGRDSQFRLRCDVMVSGEENAQSAYRSELTGIMAAVTIVDLICAFFRSPQDRSLWSATASLLLKEYLTHRLHYNSENILT
jgi:hypothetical protein